MFDSLESIPRTAACQASLSITNSLGYSNSCPLNGWCHLTISSSVVPFSSCLQSFPASWSFPKSQFFASGGQKIGVLASAWGLPMSIQGWFPLGWTGWISMLSKGLLWDFFSTTVQKHPLFGAQPSSWSNSHPYMTTGKTIALTTQSFVTKVVFLLPNTLSRFVTVFLPRNKRLLVSRLKARLLWVFRCC